MSESRDVTKGTIFSYCDSNTPADILTGAAYVTSFLRETVPAYIDCGQGLSDDSSTGLLLILCGIENSINLAIERL